MSKYEKSNTVKTPETAERSAEPSEVKLAADSALDLTIDAANDHTRRLQQDIEAFLSNSDFSYDKYGFPSPTEIIKRERGGARAARAFIQSRRLNEGTPAIVKLADEIYLRESGRKSQRSARSDEYLQTLLDDCKVTDVVTNPGENPVDEEIPDAIDHDTDEESAKVIPAMRLTSVDIDNNPIENASSNSSDILSGPQVVIRLNPATAVENTSSKYPDPNSEVQRALERMERRDSQDSTTGQTVTRFANNSPQDLEPLTKQEEKDREALAAAIDIMTNILETRWKITMLDEEIAPILDSVSEKFHKGIPMTLLSLRSYSLNQQDHTTVDRINRHEQLELTLKGYEEAFSSLPSIKQNPDENSSFYRAVVISAQRRLDSMQKAFEKKRSETIAKARENIERERQSLLRPKLSPKAAKRLEYGQKRARQKDNIAALTEAVKRDEEGADSRPSWENDISESLVKYARKVGSDNLARVTAQARKLDAKWDKRLAFPLSDDDASELERDTSEVLNAEDGMMLKTLMANGVIPDNVSPAQLRNILERANRIIVLRQAKCYNIGRIATALANTGELVGSSAAYALNLLPGPTAGYLYYDRTRRRRQRANERLTEHAVKEN